jgi:hypothetical protein
LRQKKKKEQHYKHCIRSSFYLLFFILRLVLLDLHASFGANGYLCISLGTWIFVHQSGHLYICASVWALGYLCISLGTCIFVHQSGHLDICASVGTVGYLCISRDTWIFVNQSGHLDICASVEASGSATMSLCYVHCATSKNMMMIRIFISM